MSCDEEMQLDSDHLNNRQGVSLSAAAAAASAGSNNSSSSSSSSGNNSAAAGTGNGNGSGASAADTRLGTSVTGADGVSLSLGEYEECLIESENGEEPTGLMGAAFHSRVPFDKMTSLECQYFPGTIYKCNSKKKLK